MLQQVFGWADDEYDKIRVERAEEAIRRTVEWERVNPPAGFTPHQFDYVAEDAL